MQHQLRVLSATTALVVLLLLGVGVDDVDSYYGYGLGMPDPLFDPNCIDEFKSCSVWAKNGLCCEQFYFDRCQASCTPCGPGPAACNISGRIYPSGTEFKKNCMTFHCDDGELYTDNKYNSECGTCSIQNDPHFLSYHDVKFDWHGKETYALSQRDNDECPHEYINAKFDDCITGLPWATCLHTIYFQPQADTTILIVKADNVQNSLVIVNGVINIITAHEDGKLQILDGAVDSEFPVLAWINDDCLHFMGTNENGFLIKLCSWSLKIFAHPKLSNNLGGLCGNWDKDSVRYSEGSRDVWEENICTDVGIELGWTTTGVSLDACKDMCDDSARHLTEPCNAILYKPNHCILLRCPLPIPDPTISNLEYLGYVKGGIDKLRLRSGAVVIPPKTDGSWANMIIDETFGHDWQVSCARVVTPAVIEANPCSLDETILDEINQVCEAAVNEKVTKGLSDRKIAAMKADCSFDRCIAIKAENETLAAIWLEEVKIQVQREEMEVKNTVKIIHDPCFIGGKEYSSGTKWEDNCMGFYCEKGILYTTNKYNSHCTSCMAKNDPHFETFDGVLYDWHGHSTYILSQEGKEDCPDTFVSSRFQPCAVGAPGATCVHTIYIQFTQSVFIEVKVENNMHNAEIIVDGFTQNIPAESENEIQLLYSAFGDEESAVFGWMNGECLHIIGFKKRGYLIKICKWSVKIFAHPSKASKLYGLCGDSNGDTSHDLKLRNGDTVNPPGRCFLCFANKNVDVKFGNDWEIKDCEAIANFTAGPTIEPVNLCDADEATLQGYYSKCEDTLEFGAQVSTTVKERILGDCAFDQCIAANADDETLGNEWITECQVIVTTEEEEIINTIQVPLICDPPCKNEGVCIGSTNTCKCKAGFTGLQCEDKDPDSCSLGGKLYKSGGEWQENCMMFYCKKGKFYSSGTYNGNCGICQVNNDPHFVTYDGVSYDWHGHSTYTLSQRGDGSCPEVSVNGKFKECGPKFPFATCVDTIYYQHDKEINIKIVKHTSIFGQVSFTVHVNEFENIIKNDLDEGEMQPLRCKEKEYPVFAWNYDNCIQIMGFESKGFMIKLCSWSFKIYAHPFWSSNLFGLCGDFNNDKNEDLKMRNGAIISPPTGWINKNVDAKFGDDWQVNNCEEEDGVRTPPGIGNGQNEAIPCEADDDVLDGYRNDCQDIIDKGRALLSDAAKQRFIDACVFDRCLAFRLADITDDSDIVVKWMNELEVMFKQEEEETANTVEYPLGSGKCPGGYMELASQCLRINIELSLNWEDARIHCESKSGRLAVLLKPEELQLFLNENHNGLRFWIGASYLVDEETNGAWTWLSGDIISGRPKFPWGPFEPNNVNGNEHCLEYNGQLKFYNDVACGDTINFICEANTVSKEEGYCIIDEKSYPNGQKWTEGCMTYFCKDGDFYTDNKYNGECGSCTAKNDPHFTTFDGTTYDWHGQSTYTVAQEGSSDCPEIFVHGQFSTCAVGMPGATCLHTIYFQPVKNTHIKIIKGNNIEDSEIYVDGYFQQINVIEEGQLQIIKGPNNKLKPAFMWIYGGCLHFMAFDRQGLMIKLCDWSLKVFAHPVAANKLHGLCGDWNRNKVGDLKKRNGDIINPPGGFWASKNVNEEFGNDWEIVGSCSETADVELPAEPHTNTDGCTLQTMVQEAFINACQNALDDVKDILDDNKFTQLIESCAFDLCLAKQSGNATISEIWFKAIILNAQQEKEEIENTIKAKIPGSCYLDGTEYPQGTEWVENCMMYYCKNGKFYSSNSYNGDCGSCDANNDPHFKTFDGVTYDWHGHSTYVVSQHGPEVCPDTYVNSQFMKCASGMPHATCVHIVYIQPLKGTLIKVVKHTDITQSEVHIDGFSQKVSVTGDGEIQILKGPNDQEKHAFAWFFNDCLHIQGFKVSGYLVKICHWSMKVFAHPLLANNLYGLCGDWNRDKAGDLKLRDGVTIISPPTGFWASKNVNAEFGNDWEIKPCTDNTDITIGGEAVMENPCEATPDELDEYHESCTNELTAKNNGLDEIKLQLLIDDCAFDRCIASQSGDANLIELWLIATVGILEEEIQEQVNTGLGSGACYIGGVGYPSGQEWQENCMRYYCEEGHFYSRKVYNTECGHCSSRNDPHFVTFDGVKFDWHGQSTYVLSQQSSIDCPNAFVNSKFKNCAFGLPGATCLDTIFFKKENSPVVKIVKNEGNVQNSEIEIDGNVQQLTANNDGELQILKGPNNKEYPLLGLIHDGCIHIIGFDESGYLIKLCKWELTIYSHPLIRDNLYGLCGDWDNHANGDLKLRNGEIIPAPGTGGGFFAFLRAMNKNVDKRFGNDWEVKECPTFVFEPVDFEEIPENFCDASEDELKKYETSCTEKVNDRNKGKTLDEELLNEIIEDCIFDRCIATQTGNETIIEEWIEECGVIVDQKEKEKENTIVPGSCFMNGEIYLSGTEWTHNCMTYYCEQGKFYSSNKYNGECGSCTLSNDPHFTSFDGVTFDWHGHSTYVLSQQSAESCPDVFVNSQFGECVIGHPDATCLDTIYFQPAEDTLIKIVKDINHILNSKIYVNGHLQKIFVKNNGELQILKGANNIKLSAFGWINNDCIYLTGFDISGYMIKICHWFLKIYVHPSQKNKLYGMCGDWNNNKDGDLKLRNGNKIAAPSGGGFAGQQVQSEFGNDWEVDVDCTTNAGNLISTVEVKETHCTASEVEQENYLRKCRDTLTPLQNGLLPEEKLNEIIGECAFDRCIAIQTENEGLAEIWLKECGVRVEEETEEIKNTVERGSCYIDGKSYMNGMEWEVGCISHYCKDGKFYSHDTYNRDCGHCSVANDPHFTTYDGTTYDWHGHNTYVLSQNGPDNCPNEYVNSKFKSCTSGRSGATCTDELYFKIMGDYEIKIVKAVQLKFSEVFVNGYKQVIAVKPKGELQLLKGPHNQEVPIFAWFIGDCIHIIGFNNQGFMIKLCGWYVNVYAHPSLAPNLYGLCGDWDGKRNGDLKKRDSSIINPPGGWWGTKNVDRQFGEDWEIKTFCPSKYHVVLEENDNTESACVDPKQEYYDACKEVIEGSHNSLAKIALEPLIEDCAFDRCVAESVEPEAERQKTVKEFMRKWEMVVHQTQEEVDNTGGGTCKDGFKKVGTQCLYFGTRQKTRDGTVGNDDGSLSWDDAFNRCMDLGGQLAVIKDHEAFIKYLADHYNSYNYWVGLTDKGIEGTFRWIDHSDLKEGFKWNRGEPNNHWGREDCVHISSLYGGVYNDYECPKKLDFVCDDVSGKSTYPEPASFTTVQRLDDEHITWETEACNNIFCGCIKLFGGVCPGKTYHHDYVLFTAKGSHDNKVHLVYIEKPIDHEPFVIKFCGDDRDLHQGAYDLQDGRSGLVYIQPAVGEKNPPSLELFNIWHKTDETLAKAALTRNNAHETTSFIGTWNKVPC